MTNPKAPIAAIYVLKVNLQCCKACPVKIKKKLHRVPGVGTVAIDVAEGLVKIGGIDNLDPSILIKAVARTGKIAQLQSIEKLTNDAIDSGQPSNPSGDADGLCNNIGEAQKVISCSDRFSDHSCRSGQIHINEPVAVRPPPPTWLFMRRPSPFGVLRCGGRGDYRLPMMDPTPPPPPRPMVSMPPPLPPAPVYYRFPEPPPEVPPPNGYNQWPEPPPEAPPCCCHQHPPPTGSAPGHYVFSDDNLEGCVIV